MEEQIDEFKREVTENRENFKRSAPFISTKEFEMDFNKKAFDQINHFQNECKSLRDREDEMQVGHEIFNIEHTKYLDLAASWRDQAKEHSNRGCFAGAIWTNKPTNGSEWTSNFACETASPVPYFLLRSSTEIASLDMY